MNDEFKTTHNSALSTHNLALSTHNSAPAEGAYIDSWGRGVEKITEACRESGLPPPQFIERSGGILVELQGTPVKTPVKLGNELGNAPKTVSEMAFILYTPRLMIFLNYP